MDGSREPEGSAATGRSAAESAARRFRQGDAAATTEVQKRIARILVFRGYGMPAAEREDLVQDVMTQVWQATQRPGFDPAAGFWGFVELVTARRSIDWLRKRREVAQLDDQLPDSAATPAERAIDRQRARLAGRALAGLESPCRELIRLYVGEGRNYREISSLLGKNEGALRAQMFRCVRSARRLLSELIESDGLAGRSGDPS